VLSGEEEAQWIYTGVAHALQPLPDTVTLVDIGGGSTEIIGKTTENKPVFRSVTVGCVTLTERFLKHDPPDSDELGTARRYLEETFKPFKAALPAVPERLIGVGGTVTTAAAIFRGLNRYDPSLVHGTVLALSDIRRLIDRLSLLPLGERKRAMGIDEERADIFIGGLLILTTFMKLLEASSVQVSDRGILYGAIIEGLRYP
jgi:exopolyphosphatase/guanosine-5'-triphosphate,3'-diphosphate pyrophosphatase